MHPKLFQSALRVATGWVPGLGTFVEEALEHANARGERQSKLAKLLDFDDHASLSTSSPVALLRAHFGVVPFHGRESELADLDVWCDADRPLALRLYTAPGGFGKTRLLRYFVRQRRSTKWDGGFLSAGKLNDGGAPLLFEGAKKPLLLVLDYAESRRPEVEAVIRGARASRRKVRVVLLARAEGDWWDELRRAGDGVGDFFQGPAADLPIRLSPLTDSPKLRLQSYEMAVEAFATVRNVAVPGAPPPPLDHEDFERVLFIHAAALAAVEGQQISAPELLGWLVEREREGIERVRKQRIGAGDELQRGIEHAAALLTLSQGADSRAEVVSIIARVPALSDQPRAMQESIAEALHVLYRGRRWCDGVEPDLLGEQLVNACLHDAPELVDAAFGEDVPEARLEAGLTVLNRLAQRQPAERDLLEVAIADAPSRLALPVVRVAIASGDPIGMIFANVLTRTNNRATALQLDGRIPHPTTVLGELAAEVDRILLTDLRSVRHPATEEARSRAASRANHLSNRLAKLGRRNDALVAIQEAVAIHRDLAAARPDVFRPDLAMSLNNLSNRLSDLGRPEDALLAIQEAVNIRQDLATARPDAFRPDRVNRINHLSVQLASLGRAFVAIQESSDIYRDVAAGRPDAFRLDLASSLNTLSNRLSGLGRREGALRAIQDAIDIYLELADAHADTIRPHLALSLTTLSGQLSDLGRLEEALAAIQKAVAIRRELAAARPDSFRPDLARSLNNLSGRLSDLLRRNEAFDAIREAVDIYRDLARARPEAFRPDLAISLNNLSGCLSYLGRGEEALVAIQDAVAIHRDLAIAGHDAFQPDLARSMSILHDRLRESGDLPAALVATNEALGILEPCFRSHPAALAPFMTVIANDCERTAGALGVEPDRPRLQAIRQILATLQEDD